MDMRIAIGLSRFRNANCCSGSRDAPVVRQWTHRPRKRISSARGDSNFVSRLALSTIWNSKMMDMVIAVGSARKPKLAAVREALAEISGLLFRDPRLSAEVMGIEVESGVSHTPSTRVELMRGARQRAEALQSIARQRNASWHYFVGLEGGLDSVEENGQRRVFLESWAYVSDGQRGHFGRSGALELPESLAEEVLGRGTELSIAIDSFAQQTGIRDAQGAWGVLSANKITRQEAFRVAVIAAFAPFYKAEFYNREVAGRSLAAG
jgi:inosine/xanthosine triphosphatase